jgi:putative hydrolase of the HAD superfamily
MTSQYIEIIRRHSQPRTPRETDALADVQTLPDIKAVYFDIYGTLLMSGCGDIGVVAESPTERAFHDALAACGVTVDASDTLLRQAIERYHTVAKGQGTAYPEVVIEEIWADVLAQLPLADDLRAGVDLARLAIEYEVRANPVWPMPNLRECLQQLQASGCRLGIISNAQFFTPLLFPAVVGKSLEELGFASDWCFYSYAMRRAKPDTYLYEQAALAAQKAGISPGEVLYIGNDMRNDIAPAQAIGFRTALFAGDATSLRYREGDPLVRGVRPDRVVTDLADLPRCIGARQNGDERGVE